MYNLKNNGSAPKIETAIPKQDSFNTTPKLKKGKYKKIQNDSFTVNGVQAF